MDRRYYFERNMLALSAQNPALCTRLSAAETTLNCYKMLEARSGDVVPAMVDHSGAAHPLHSMIDPRREAERLAATLCRPDGASTAGFLVFLGLGAGYAVEAALSLAGVSRVLIIDYGINGIAELFCSKEYIKILGDPRCLLLVDPAPQALAAAILEQYHPVLSGGIRTLPLRARTELDAKLFGASVEAIQGAIEKVSSDYSVQAYFGTRWFSNIIRNLQAAEAQNRSAPPVREAAICAAGPSLDGQMQMIAEQKSKTPGLFVIAADTALPALLRRGITPNAAVSIDCQHISYYHFLGTGCRDIPLFLDISSPPLLSGVSASPFFFSGGHPLARYISRAWRPLPHVDTSGGNVTYACLSLAGSLGAERIKVYGADFSYPGCRVYARGTYVYPYFEQRQNRRRTLEAQVSALLYRSPFLPPEDSGGSAANDGSAHCGAYHETAALRFYRKAFETAAAGMEAEITVAPGQGAPIHIQRKKAKSGSPRNLKIFAPGRARMSAATFLEQYRNDIAALPPPPGNAGTYISRLKGGELEVFFTLLPLAAALKRRQMELPTAELIEAVKQHSIKQIEQVLGGGA